MSREILFSITRDSFEWQFMTAGGNGGQKQNKTSSACRCTHKASGAVGMCREERQQHVNRERAWKRCIETKEFKGWLKLETAKRQKSYIDLDKEVERQIQDILVEVKDDDGKWRKEAEL